MEPCYSLIMGKTQNSKSDHKSYLICILQATVSKCENVTVVMISTAYETTRESSRIRDFTLESDFNAYTLRSVE